jgi:hypothetical protein
MRRAVVVPLASLFLFAITPVLSAVEPPKIEELRLEQLEPFFFHVRFKAPDDLLLPAWGSDDPTALARLPRLISDYSEVVNLVRVNSADFKRGPLEFVGVWPRHDNAKMARTLCEAADFRLIYPRSDPNAKEGDPFEKCSWVEFPIVLKFADARIVRQPADSNRKDKIAADDLEGLYFAGLQARFAQLQRQAPDFGFYPFAQAALARRYKLPLPPTFESSTAVQQEYRRFYETLAGGSALSDSLQINRLLRTRTAGREERDIPVKSIEGVTIPQHDWKKMIGERKPAEEPLARFIPADNYYVRLRSLPKLLQVAELLDLWGNNLLHAFEYRSRDYRLRERYETQLCLPAERLANAIAPGFLHGIAITGSDPYLRDGTDLTVIFHLTEPSVFLKAHDAAIAETRKKWAQQWKQGKVQDGNDAFESFATPLREISVFRAVVGHFVIVSNSAAGMKRVLAVKRTEEPSLADSLDFKYMRTCFKADDRDEDGFAFLSDAFIRRLSSPADRIKQARRAEALAALHLATNAAILRGWTRSISSEFDAGLWDGYLENADLAVPDGKPVRWDKVRNVAVADHYGTIHFATPLIEQSIDRVTKSEKAGYEEYRRDYLRLWNRFFDPVGLRFHQNDKAVKFEAFILPLVSSNDYQWLRQLAGDGTVKLDASKITAKTLLQFNARFNMGGFFNIDPGSLFIRVEDSPLLKDFVKLLIENERAGRALKDLPPEALQKLLQMPITLGIEGDAVKSIKPLLELIRANIKCDDIDQEYRGITIKGRRLHADDPLNREVNSPDVKDPFRLSFYYAEIGEGLYSSFRLEQIKQLIDQHKDAKDHKPDGDEISAALRILPRAAENAREALQMYLEWQTHRRALPTNAVWHALHHSVIPPGASDDERRTLARQYLGYLPVSPDGSDYRYDPRTDEVVNRRHGSYRQPTLWPALAADAPLQKVFTQLEALQFQLRFREDGVHTTIIWEKR